MRKIEALILFISSLLSIYVSYKVLISFYWQISLTQDWSNSELIIPINVVEKIDTNFPNITNAALPLDAMKMRYYIREGRFDTLGYFLNKSIKSNPFMGVEQNILSQYLYNIGEYDSAYKLANKAFNKLPNNQLHGSVLIASQIKLDSLKQAVQTFEKIRYKSEAHYLLFLKSLIEDNDTIYLKKYLDESRDLLKDNEDFKKFDQIQKAGYDNYYNAQGYNQMAKIDFEDGYIDQSIRKYKKSLELNPYNHDTYINLGKVFFKSFDDSVKVANKMFRESIELYNKSGEAYFYLGVTEYIIKEIKKDSICKIFLKSYDLGYKESRPILKQYSCKL